MKVTWKDKVIAEAPREELIYIEGNFYFPPSAVKMELIEKSDTPYTCPWRGRCQYFNIADGESNSADNAWSFPEPLPMAIDTVKKDFANYIAFSKDGMSVSKTKTGIAVVMVVAAAALFMVYFNSEPEEPAPVERPPESTKPVPVRSESTPVPEPVVTRGFVIAVSAVSKSVNGQEIGLIVTNDSDTPLELDPDKQFKLVGLKTQTARDPIVSKTTVGFKSSVAPGQEAKGSVTFDVFKEEESELRFYPDVASQTFIIVPLIALPSSH